jgi:hypothetical protein
MLRELKQGDAHSGRRWFTSPDMDLIVWYEGERVRAFELCYDKGTDEKALRWRDGEVVGHARIEPGEPRGIKHKQSPIHVADGMPDYGYILKALRRESAGDVPADVLAVVERVLKP